MAPKEQKPRIFRVAIIDNISHKHLLNFRFSQTGLLVRIISIIVTFTAIVYCTIAFTPIKTFIPGYPDAQSKRAAIQNAIKIDSLENVIYRWEVYSENLKRVLVGDQTVKIDSIINPQNASSIEKSRLQALQKQDSVLRAHIKSEEQFGIAERTIRNLPIEGMHLFSPVAGVISQEWDATKHPYVEIVAPEESSVQSILDGTVIYKSWSAESGYTIQIQHSGNIISIYSGAERLLKKVGDSVKAGTAIAISRSQENENEVKPMTFELWCNGENLDPEKYINF